jgi:hypothetical protein
VLLSRLNALSLRPTSRGLRVGEYHDAWSVSPDRRKLALGLSMSGRRRVGVGVLDFATLRLVRKVQTGIAAEAVAWLAPRRLVAALQDGRVALVDPVSGEIVREARGRGEPRRSARTRNLLVVLFADPFLGGPARLAVADAHGRVRSAMLDRIRLRVHTVRGRAYADGAGLAVQAARNRAYVVAAGAPVAVIELTTMRVLYHRVEPLAVSAAALERQRRALWVGNGRFAIYGHDVVAGAGGKDKVVAAGVRLVDSRDWSSCTLDARASSAVVADGRLLAYGTVGSASPGIRFYTPRWHKTHALLQTEPVWDVKVAGRLAYMRTRSAVRVVNVRAARVLRKIAPPPELVDVIVPTAPAR